MSCSLLDLKAYAVGELAEREKSTVDDHVRGCENCREELDRLRLTWSALASLQDEEIPRRIAFVSDQVFEPRWWQTIWRSGPAMGFASASLLAAAIVAHGFLGYGFPGHGFAHPAATATGAQLDTAQIERRMEAGVNARVDAAVAQAVSAAQAKQSAEFARLLKATEHQRQMDLADFEQASEYYEKQMHRFEVASNEGPAQ
ncbi:MAG: hypothetical protein JOZ32_09555 [Bryobacterales bacterium]|nr:hypothetical protein [Bryobacterales bacterium]